MKKTAKKLKRLPWESVAEARARVAWENSEERKEEHARAQEEIAKDYFKQIFPLLFEVALWEEAPFTKEQERAWEILALQSFLARRCGALFKDLLCELGTILQKHPEAQEEWLEFLRLFAWKHGFGAWAGKHTAKEIFCRD